MDKDTKLIFEAYADICEDVRSGVRRDIDINPDAERIRPQFNLSTAGGVAFIDLMDDEELASHLDLLKDRVLKRAGANRYSALATVLAEYGDRSVSRIIKFVTPEVQEDLNDIEIDFEHFGQGSISAESGEVLADLQKRLSISSFPGLLDILVRFAHDTHDEFRNFVKNYVIKTSGVNMSTNNPEPEKFTGPNIILPSSQ